MENRELDRYLKRYLNGDDDAFDIIYEETKKSVYLSIYSIIKDKFLIEDLMQDTYMKALKSINYYKFGTNFKAWISRIARNNAINMFNKRKREDLVDTDDDRQELFGETQNNYLLDETLKILDGYEKDIIIYRIILGLKFKEISEILRLPLGTIFWVYQKAIKKVKKEIYDEI